METQRKILLVEDEEDIVRLVKFTLTKRGFEVVVTPDGLSALEIVAEEKPNLILLDVMMPTLNGYETCKKLKESPQTRGIPVVMLSAKAQAQEKEVAKEVGAAYFIAKPFNPKELGDKIESILRAK